MKAGFGLRLEAVFFVAAFFAGFAAFLVVFLLAAFFVAFFFAIVRFPPLRVVCTFLYL